jgi:endonuclease YncB( thermonuclease family)
MASADAAASPSLSHPLSSRSFPLHLFRLVACAVTLLGVALPAGAAELHGNVVGVSDGDTITVLDDARMPRKVRLAGIDAPEMRQAYGARAKHHLASLVFGKPVVVVWHKRDRYGRIVGNVHVVVSGACGQADCARREDVGLAQLESGLAWHYKRYQSEQTVEDRGLYARTENEARTKREGLWKDARPIPPWEYRGGQRAG